jgi:iron(III) transport system substrate-binding protein
MRRISRRGIRVTVGAGMVVAVIASISACSSNTPGSDGGTASAGNSVADIVNYSGSDREQHLYQCAQAEGQVTFYTSYSKAQDAVNAFEKDYPGVKVNLFQSATDLVTRINQEEQAGQHNFDVYDDILGGLTRDNNLFVELDSPNQADMRTPDKYEMETRGSVLSVGYNTNEITGSEVPTDWKDLIDPKYAGKLFVNTAPSMPALIGFLAHVEGSDYVTALAKNAKAQQLASSGQRDQIISGETPMGMLQSSAYYGLYTLDQGAPFGWSVMSPMMSEFAGISISKNAAHPCAAALLTDWFTTKGGTAAQLATTQRFSSPFKDDPILPFTIPGVDTSKLDIIDKLDPSLWQGKYDSYAGYEQANEELFSQLFLNG